MTGFNRCFGVYFNDKSHRIDDADYKVNLKVSNYPYGTKLSEIIDFINIYLKKNGIREFELNKIDKLKILTMDKFVIGFDSF